ncbi:hypothetical protein [Embleya hyalina]|uniref:Uncharacterized protein n=1 Tax=Embleya hyalina TaxID=516124 RepID=A0A401YDD5_9ACTN|nr:hypothetical protein [Embleya hyalina]GCD92582.1 hypothetical protein EHYA_00221 [Embleya hyalina]
MSAGTPATAELLLRCADPKLAARVRARLGIVPGPGAAPAPELGRGTPDKPTDRTSWARSADTRETRFLSAATRDWDEVCEAHRREPIREFARTILLADRSCPPRVALELVVAPPEPLRSQWTTRPLEAALLSGVLTPRRVALAATPGWWAIRSLEFFVRPRRYRRLAAIDRVLDEAAELLPGDDLAAWGWLIAHAPDHRGTFPQLCADAVRLSGAAGTGAGTDAAVMGREFDAVVPGPAVGEWKRWGAFSPAGMLGRVDPAIAARVVAALPVEVVRGFARAGTALAGRVVLPALKRVPEHTWDLVHDVVPTASTVERLLALHDPNVNAALLSAHPGPDAAYAIHRATRRDARPRVRLPLERRAWLSSRLASDCAEAVHGHHPYLIRAAFEHYGARGLGGPATLRGLLGLWETRGRVALFDRRVRLRLDGEYETLRTFLDTTRALDGLRRLRREVAGSGRPAALLAAMRRNPEIATRHVPDTFWPEAIAAHRRGELPGAVLANLAAQPRCPDELALAACDSDPEAAARVGRRSPAHARAALGHPLREPLRDRPSEWIDEADNWYVDAVADGTLTMREFVETAQPPLRMLGALDAFAALLPEELDEARRLIAAHVANTLGDSVDAWVIAGRIVPDFPGSLPELLTTAAAAAT